MRLLLLSDLHLDSTTAGMRRLPDLELALDRVATIAIKEKVDEVFFLGDLADADSGSIIIRVLDVAMKFAGSMAANCIATRWVAGNHDSIEDGEGHTTILPIGNIGGAFIYERPTTIMAGPEADIPVSFLPYPTRGCQYDPEQYVLENCLSGSIVAGHCTYIDGAVLGSESRDMARGGSFSFPVNACKKMGAKLLFNGHYHRQQITPGGVHIPGSLERLRFDEETNAPGILICDV
jgi:DNA repair exonuclease SbcCD nuclease subunit